MVFLSDASVREMIQEALGGGGYPSLDGDGKFPIVPSPLAEPIVTKLALQPVRVMRIPTDRNEFEFAIKELVDGIEQDHLPTLFLKVRELVNDFSPPEQESPCPADCGPDNDAGADMNDDDDQSTLSTKAEVKRIIRALLEADEEDQPNVRGQITPSALKPFRPGGSRYRPGPGKRGLFGMEPGHFAKAHEPEPDTDWEDSEFADADWDDVGAADSGDDPYPEDYLASPGYPDIGEDPDFQTWDEFEKDLSRSAWEPDPRKRELDALRGRETGDEWDALGAAVEKASAEQVQDPDAPKANKPKDAKGGEMSWEDIGKALAKEDGRDKPYGAGTVHGWAAILGRKLMYIKDYMGGAKGFQEWYDKMTDAWIEKLIKQGMEKDDDGKRLLDMDEILDLRSAIKTTYGDDGSEVAEFDQQSADIRRAVQEQPTFKEYLSKQLEKEAALDKFPLKDHGEAAKDKDAFSIFHRMKK